VRRFAAALACLAAAGCATGPAASSRPGPAGESPKGSPPASPDRPAIAFPTVSAPLLRIGLASDLSELSLPGASWIVSAGGKTSLRPGPLAFVARGTASLVRLQAGAYTEEATARSVAADLAKKTGLAPSVVFSAEKGLFAVRLGSFPSAAAAKDALPKLTAAGVAGFVVTEASGAPAIAMRDGAGNESPIAGSSADVAPAAGEEIAFQSRRYRGFLRVFVNPRGSLNVVNVVNLEDYLRGVVPAEMGPKRFDELEALKAQAIAARTYALDNLNGFGAEGYDLCATPKCQVYAGRDAEDPLTDAAVEQTRGRIATWQGKPIHALFTSTCGGATEDVRLIFSSMGAPYLSGVECGEQEKSVFDGARLPRGTRAPALSSLEWRGWVLQRISSSRRSRSSRGALWAEAFRLAGLEPRGGPPASLSPSSVYPAVLAGFGLTANRDVHLTRLDLDYAAGPPDPAAGLPADARAAYETLSRMKVGGDAGLPPPSRAMSELELGGLLMSVALRLAGVSETSGHLVRRDGGSFVVKTAGGRVSVAAETSVELARLLDGRFYPSSSLALTSGDPVTFWKRGGAVLAFWSISAAAGATFEKESTWTEWVRRVSARELALRLGGRLSGSEVRAIEIKRRGRSGRAVEAAITTDRGTVTLTGFDIRQALELPELLFTVEKGVGPDGAAEFIFVGRGWGHGVGLCQNGAYGMALSGKTSEEILKHYYPGIELGSFPPAPPPPGAPSPSSPAPAVPAVPPPGL